MESPLVLAIILAWNHLENTVEALLSFKKSNYPNLRIVVVNNGSTDSTEEFIRKNHPDVEILTSAKNLGVSGGYNLGIQHALLQNPEYILISNNDVTIAPDMISELIQALIADPSVGIGMPKIYHYGGCDRIWCTGGQWRKFPPTVKMSNYNSKNTEVINSNTQINYAPSCLLLMKTELIKKIGIFDTSYFFYFDDWDYSRRAVKAGFKLLYIPKAIMWHKISISTQKSDKPQEWWQQMGWSAARYYQLYHSMITFLIFSTWFVIREALKGKPGRILPFLRGALAYFQQNRAERYHAN